MMKASASVKRLRGSWRVSSAIGLLLLLSCTGGDCDAHRRVEERPSEVSAKPESDEAVAARLNAALAAKGAGYVPRTRHLNSDGSPRFTNRLILESSPYLLQHAHNPVNWFAWGDEAFAHAARLGRPVFLSVGYSTCHWCHVMEEESFEDEEVARYLNEHYVCIKVDREERPDIDATYMAFVQSLTGRGGWPMSVWLTPTREPFYGGTYFPPRAGVRGSRLGFMDLLRAHAERFATTPAAVVDEAMNYAKRLQATVTTEQAGDAPGARVLVEARTAAARRFDPVHGGVSGAPKFPSTMPVRLLLRIARRNGDAEAKRMATTTLDHMRNGGIYDQLGGGFHRYAVDAQWLVPHFEKMLYDNGLFALAYLEAAQATANSRYSDTAREVLNYVLREMTAPDGTFYSATDADSLAPTGHREEGVYFTWTPTELAATLTPDDTKLARAWFGVTEAGHVDGRSVLHLDRGADIVAAELGLSTSAFSTRVAHVRQTLQAARTLRPAPLRDDKVIVAWNALVVSALARAAIVLGDATYADAAVRCARALVTPRRAKKQLPHAFYAGKPRGEAFADDTALLAAALLDVFELTGDGVWLDDAIGLMEWLELAFGDSSRGGYFLTGDRHERLLLRDKPSHDGAMPSPSSVAALTWLRLYALTGDERHGQRAETTTRAFASVLSARPLALDQMLLAVDWATDNVRELVVVVPEGHGALAPAARPLVDVLQRQFVPSLALVVASESMIEGELGRRIPWLREKRLMDGKATAYVCERGTCQLPTNDPTELTRQLAVVQLLH